MQLRKWFINRTSKEIEKLYDTKKKKDEPKNKVAFEQISRQIQNKVKLAGNE